MKPSASRATAWLALAALLLPAAPFARGDRSPGFYSGVRHQSDFEKVRPVSDTVLRGKQAAGTAVGLEELPEALGRLSSAAFATTGMEEVGGRIEEAEAAVDLAEAIGQAVRAALDEGNHGELAAKLFDWFGSNTTAFNVALDALWAAVLEDRWVATDRGGWMLKVTLDDRGTRVGRFMGSDEFDGLPEVVKHSVEVTYFADPRHRDAAMGTGSVSKAEAGVEEPTARQAAAEAGVAMEPLRLRPGWTGKVGILLPPESGAFAPVFAQAGLEVQYAVVVDTGEQAAGLEAVGVSRERIYVIELLGALAAYAQARAFLEQRGAETIRLLGARSTADLSAILNQLFYDPKSPFEPPAPLTQRRSAELVLKAHLLFA